MNIYISDICLGYLAIILTFCLCSLNLFQVTIKISAGHTKFKQHAIYYGEYGGDNPAAILNTTRGNNSRNITIAVTMVGRTGNVLFGIGSGMAIAAHYNLNLCVNQGPNSINSIQSQKTLQRLTIKSSWHFVSCKFFMRIFARIFMSLLNCAPGVSILPNSKWNSTIIEHRSKDVPKGYPKVTGTGKQSQFVQSLLCLRSLLCYTRKIFKVRILGKRQNDEPRQIIWSTSAAARKSGQSFWTARLSSVMEVFENWSKNCRYYVSLGVPKSFR